MAFVLAMSAAMSDVLTKEQRSYCMSRIHGRNTAPEIFVRRSLASAGLRGYRLHYRLQGKPDIVFPAKRIAVFIDGCFWHKCPKCFVKPVTNRGFWLNKIASNTRRDRFVDASLKRSGWKILRIWEHEARSERFINIRIISRIKNDG